jgi:hypothetical protein
MFDHSIKEANRDCSTTGKLNVLCQATVAGSSCSHLAVLKLPLWGKGAVFEDFVELSFPVVEHV